MSLFILGVTLGQDSHVARCCGVCRVPWERLPSNLDRPAICTSGARENRTGNQLSPALVLLCRFCSLFPPAALLAGVVFGARALLCSVSSLWFFPSSLAPFWRGALLCCLRPLVVPARLVLLRWGCFFLREGDDSRTDHVLRVLSMQVAAEVWLCGRIRSIGLEWDIELRDRLLVHEVIRVCDQVASVPLVLMWRTSFCAFPL